MANLVNMRQSKYERRQKYKLVRSFGFSSERASRMRDWRRNILIKYLKAEKNGIRRKIKKLFRKKKKRGK